MSNVRPMTKMDNRTRLLAHQKRLGWSQVTLADRLSRMVDETISVNTVRGWLAAPDKTYSRTCPAWPSAIIERDYPER